METDFYSEEEIKNDDDKSNIFIAINITGIIYILSIFFNNQEQFENEEKYKPYELIEIGKIEANRYIKITKLKKLFETKNNSKNNYFIINSWNSAKYGRAIIINVIENNHYFDIRERYNMDIIQKIEDINGLYSSIEFFYNKKTYLLNYYQTFYLWIYNPQINQIEKTFTENQIMDNEKSHNYGTLIYEEQLKLFIIQCFSPNSRIEFYHLIEEKEKFSFQKGKCIEIKKEEGLKKVVIIVIFTKVNIYYLFLVII